MRDWGYIGHHHNRARGVGARPISCKAASIDRAWSLFLLQVDPKKARKEKSKDSSYLSRPRRSLPQEGKNSQTPRHPFKRGGTARTCPTPQINRREADAGKEGDILEICMSWGKNAKSPLKVHEFHMFVFQRVGGWVMQNNFGR